MDRYIDADKTLDMMWNALYQYEDDMEKKHGLNLTERLDVQNGFEVAHRVVVNAPAEDVVPVIHAHWEIIYESSAGVTDAKCSNCGYESLAYENDVHTDENCNYCPCCGAKMDER